MSILNTLSNVQKAAVEDTEGAVLVFAGAGSGKTRVLINRIIYLIEEKHIKPWNILAITFTNKATNEMKIRLSDMLGDANNVNVSTMHALCVKILYTFGTELGYKPNFSIYDEDSSVSVVGRVLKEFGKETKAKKVFAKQISECKNENMSLDDYVEKADLGELDPAEFKRVFNRYNQMLFQSNALDFDDLLIKALELLTKFDKVRDYYQERFKYIHVDEFQDTNIIQLKLIQALSGKYKNVFVVGDDDQSIYSWRGAEIKNILNFSKHFENPKIYKLEQNYRSNKEIVEYANRLIKNNTNRVDKNLFSEITDGEDKKVNFIESNYEYNEVDNVINTITKLKFKHGYKNSDFAILIRKNALSVIWETSFMRSGYPTRVWGAYKFFDRKEVKDIIAYLRVIVNPDDVDSLVRIINTPARGIGDATIQKLLDYSKNNNINLLSAIFEVEKTDLNSGAKRRIIEFRDLLFDLYNHNKSDSLLDFVKYLIKASKIEEELKLSTDAEDVNRWQYVEELVNFVALQVSIDNTLTLSSFLNQITLDNGKENLDADYNADKITISTMHAIKGLEFPVVFIVSCEENIIPSILSLDEGNLEEERRVMYVAMTRARDYLYISYVNGTRKNFGKSEPTMQSRFVSECQGLKPNFQRIDIMNSKNGGHNGHYAGGGNLNEYGSDRYNKYTPNPFERYSNKNTYNDPYAGYGKTKNDDILSGSGNDQSKYDYTDKAKKMLESSHKLNNQNSMSNKDYEKYKPGVKVKHIRYGIGKIKEVFGDDKGVTISVFFTGLGIKKFSLGAVNLQIVEDDE